jgi:hypothetical protein
MTFGTNGPGAMAMAFDLAAGIAVVGGPAALCRPAPVAFGGATKTGTGGRMREAEADDEDEATGESGSSSMYGWSAHAVPTARLLLALWSVSCWGFSAAQRFTFGGATELSVGGSPTEIGSALVGHVSSISTSLSET